MVIIVFEKHYLSSKIFLILLMMQNQILIKSFKKFVISTSFFMTIIFLLEIVYFAIYITLDLSLFFVISNFMLPSNLARSCFMLFKPQMAFFLLFHFQKHCFYLFHLNFFLKSNFYSTSILKFIQKIKKYSFLQF